MVHGESWQPALNRALSKYFHIWDKVVFTIICFGKTKSEALGRLKFFPEATLSPAEFYTILQYALEFLRAPAP